MKKSICFLLLFIFAAAFNNVARAKSNASFMVMADDNAEDVSIPTTMKVFLKGEAISGINMIQSTYAEGSLIVCEYDQNGKRMDGRSVNLAILNSDSKATLVQNSVASGSEETAATAFQTNNWVGRTTIVATDVQSGLQTFCYITCFDKDKNYAASSANSKVTSIVDDGTNDTGASSKITETTGNENTKWHGNHFTIDLGDNYDISLIQLMFEENKFSDNYTIDVSRNGTDWTTAYTYPTVGHDVYESGALRVDAWNENSTFTQAQRYVRFTNLKSTNDNVTLKDFQVFGNFNSKAYTSIPTVTASQDEDASTVDNDTKTATATIKIIGNDEEESVTTLDYIIRLPNGMEYHTSGEKGKEVTYTLTNLTPGSTFKAEVFASDGVNISEPAEVDIKIKELAIAPTITANIQNGSVTNSSATISYTATTTDANKTLTVLITNQTTGERTTINNVTSGTASTYTASNLTSGTPYTFTVRAYDGTLYSGTISLNLTTLSDDNLIVTFTVGNETHEKVSGKTGQLKELINKELNNNADGFTTVKSLTVVSGALNGADIATLRQMAKGNDYVNIDAVETQNIADIENSGFSNPDGWKQGVLTDLDLSNATFEASTDTYITEYSATTSDNVTTYNKKQEWKIGQDSNDVPEKAFVACKGLENVILPSGKVNTEAFNNCSNLKTVKVKDNGSVTAVGGQAFKNCDALTQIGETANLIDLSSVEGNELKEKAFWGADALTEVKFSKNLTIIPNNCFQICSSLTTANLNVFNDKDAKLEQIQDRAFCDDHKFVLGTDGVYSFPNSIKIIGAYAFANIEVREVALPDNPEYTIIQNGLFGWNSNDGNEKYTLTTVHIPANVTAIKDEAFMDDHDLTGLATTIDNGAKITSIGPSAFFNNKEMKDADFTRLIKDITVVNSNTFQSCTSLTKIDLTEATNGITEVYDGGFYNCNNVKSIKLGNKIGEVHNNAFSTCTSNETIDLGSATKLDNYAFGLNSSLKELKVTRATAPTTPEKLTEMVEDKDGNLQQVVYDPFGNISSNQVTVNFTGEANNYAPDGNTGYMSYRKNNAFMRLLTKHLNEDNEQYNVANQMHADVTLKRTFKAGYNTLALPFGSPDNNDRPVSCAKVFENALFNGNDNAHKISVYRGLKGNTFMFLKYANTGTDPLDEFEPILVYMTNEDTKAATIKAVGETQTSKVKTDYYDLQSTKVGDQYYLFENVDVNYDKNNNKFYTHTTPSSFVDSNGHAFTGAINDKDWNWLQGATNDYAFTGSYVNTTQGLKTGDYFIQTKKDGKSYFYKVDTSSNKYRIKGFRGWFTPASTSQAKYSQLSIEEFDPNDGTTTSINNIDSYETISTGDVYNLNGQCVRKGATDLKGLANGIYIWKGRKVVVK